MAASTFPNKSAWIWLSFAGLIVGCASVAQMADIAGKAGITDRLNISDKQTESIVKSAEAVGKTFEDITPEQEYYIGRAVAATVLASYKSLNKPVVNRYLNELGQSLSQVSDLPETFDGYHFLAIDSDEINAFAAPGGLILVARGLLLCCSSEDALAAVLAHEIGHVANKHGLKSIRKGRLNTALATVASEGAKNLGNDEVAKLTEDFQGAIGDIATTMMNSGYSRTLEAEADDAAVDVMMRLGYDPNAFVSMLETIVKKSPLAKKGSVMHGFAKTHPDPQTRISAVKKRIGATAVAASQPESRKARFGKAIAGL